MDLVIESESAGGTGPGLRGILFTSSTGVVGCRQAGKPQEVAGAVGAWLLPEVR